MALEPFLGPWPLLQFRNLLYTDGTSDQTVARPLRIQDNTNRINTYAHTQTYMP
jgi:hypothetical protein